MPKRYVVSYPHVHFFSTNIVFEQALHLQPHGKDILYNIAMIQQKAAEMLLSIPPAKRSLKDLQRAIEQAQQAQK